ncbi:MAG: hypothetical protein ACQEQU_04200 [Spirochaetota bacterium]
MEMTHEAQLLLDRYLEAFSRRLPLSTRKKVTEELKDSLLQYLEENYTADHEEITAEEMKEALKEFGAPGKLALSYNEHDYLISPALFPLYRLVIFIAAGASAFAVIVQGLVSAAKGLFTLSSFFLLIPQFITAFASAVGFTTIVFYCIERWGKTRDWGEELYKDWSPDTLQKKVPSNSVSKSEQIISILFSAALIVVLLLFAEQIGIYFPGENACIFIPILRDGFFAFVPVLIVRILLGIALSGVLLYQGGFYLRTNMFSVLLGCIDIVIAIIFIRNGTSFFFDFTALTRIGVDILAPLVRVLFYGILVLIIVLSVIEIIKRITAMRDHPQS